MAEISKKITIGKITIPKPEAGNITLSVAYGKEMIKLYPNGDINMSKKNLLQMIWKL